jgi:hypothetical protein
MPVPLPLQPSGNINLPPLPGDPPSLQDVLKAKSFNTAVKVDNGKYAASIRYLLIYL